MCTIDTLTTQIQYEQTKINIYIIESMWEKNMIDGDKSNGGASLHDAKI